MTSRLYDLALVFGLFVAASGCGLWLLDRARLRAGGRIQQVCFATGLGLGLLGYVTFSLGMMSLLRQSFIAGAYVIVLFLGLRGWYSFIHRSLSVAHWLPAVVGLPFMSKGFK